jgi:L-threonylcarbamoyladenylate synthase
MSAGPEEIASAVRSLKRGGLVAFPTETVYGLGALALDAASVRRVFALKGRPSTNPLIVHVTGETMARTLTTRWTEACSKLAARFWPGPLTIVVPRAAHVPLEVTGGGETVAIRCPAHPLTLALIETVGEPLVGPSANRAGFVSPTTAAHVEHEFGDAIERGELMVLDGGACRAGIESTVVSLVSEEPTILRPGVIGGGVIGDALGRPVRVDTGTERAGEGAMASPGRMMSHYAPRTPAMLVEGRAIADVVASAGVPVALIAISRPTVDVHTLIALPPDAIGYASSLYRALREADAAGAGLIVIERPPLDGQDAEIWMAIHDRLRRATAKRSEA